MSKLNIEAGEDLDRLIAIMVFGWEFDDAWGCLVPKGHPAPPLWIPNPDGSNTSVMNTMDNPSYPYSVHYGGDKPYVKKYSTSIEDAWDVITRMEDLDYWFEMTNVIPNSDPIVYEVSFSGQKGKGYACDDTPSLTICRAALDALCK